MLIIINHYLHDIRQVSFTVQWRAWSKVYELKDLLLEEVSTHTKVRIYNNLRFLNEPYQFPLIQFNSIVAPN